MYVCVYVLANITTDIELKMFIILKQANPVFR